MIRRLVAAATAAILAGALVGPVLAAQPAGAADAVPVTYPGPSYGSASPRPTADKPQSKLWFNDGSWWALMLDAATTRVDIAELLPDHTWRDTGVVVDNRPTSTGDALWQGGVLVVASRVASGALLVNRFTYDAVQRTYVPTAGYPATAAGGGSESATIDRDSTGQLWVTYTQNSLVWVTHSTTNDATWVAPYRPQVPDTAIAADDISALLAFTGKIGVMWSDQASAAFRMAVHVDGQPDDQWTVETPLSGPDMADDHINLKQLAGDDQGRAFAVVKTSQGDNGEPLSSPLIELLVRSQAGVWSNQVVATRGDNWTRPQLAIDRTNNRLFVLATTPEGGGEIHYKTASLDAPSFAPGAGAVFMSWPNARINNVTTTKDAVDATTGLVALASDEYALRYYHAELSLSGTPADSSPPSVPTGVTATATSPSSIDVSWAASTDDVGVTGYTVYRDGTAIANVGGTSYSDTGLVAGTTYSYTVAARDAAGNLSAQSAPATATTPTPTGIVRHGSAFGANSTATSLVLSTPAPTQAGDILLATVESRGQVTLSAPAGWSLVRTDHNGSSMTTSTWWRLATAAGPSSITFQISSSQAAAGGVVAYGGVDGTDPIAAAAGQANTSSKTITAPSLTTTSAAVFVGIFGTATDATITSPLQMTPVGNAASTAGKYKVAANVDDEQEAAGLTTGPRQAQATKGAPNIGQLVALRPGSFTPDTTPPSIPTGVTATAVSSSQIDVAWQASTDDVGVTGYRVYRDGALATTVATTSWRDSGLAASSTHSYTVDALDAAGNYSATSSPPATATTTASDPVSGIVRHGVALAANPTATTLTIPTPAGTLAGDVLLATLDVRGHPTVTAPAGWTLVRSDVNSTTMSTSTWWRVATTSEPASHTFQLSSAQAAAGAIAAYGGVDTVNPIAASSGQINASSTTIIAPSVTTTGPTQLVGLFGTATDTSVTAPAGMTNLGSIASNAGTYKVTCNIDDQVLTTGTSTGDQQATALRAAANIGELIALRPS